MVVPSQLFENGQTPCGRCGKMNDLGSSDALYYADDSVRCTHCGFLFIRHKKRQIAKITEMAKTNPEWLPLIRAGSTGELKRRLDELVPIADEDGGQNDEDGNGDHNG